MNAFQNIHKDITDFLAKQGIQTPTDIQERAIPALLGEPIHSLLLSPTGSGKTEAALLPLLDALYRQKSKQELYGIYILYITPLKALNRDVFKRIEDLCEHLGIMVSVRHGDTTPYGRRKQAITPPNLLITTPESLQAIIPGKRMREHLKTVFAVVVDEIHELADSKRGTQLALGLERLNRLVRISPIRIGLSATVGNPKEVASLLGGTDRPVRSIWAGYDARKMIVGVQMPMPDDQDKELGRRLSYPPHSVARLRTIVELIEKHTSTLVFTNTRSFAEVMGAKMRALGTSYEFDVHHGSLAKDVRLEAENKLKQGVSKAIIATSSLELGIDIGQADLVIQYSSPREVSRALQRIGRAGHTVGKIPKGVIIATANLDDITESGVILGRARKNKVENARIPQKSWDVLCQQINGILLDQNEIMSTELLELVKSAYPYRTVTSEELEKLLVFMIDRRMIVKEGNLVKRYGKTRTSYYEHLSTIPDVRQVRAVDIATRSSIGVLDEDFVSQNVEAGSVFVIRGRPWSVVSVDDETGEVLCAPATGTESEAPRWIGEMIPVPFEVAVEVAKVWNRVITDDDSIGSDWLGDEYKLSSMAQDYLVKVVKEAQDVLGALPSEDLLVVESFEGGLVIHAPLGTKANETLGVVVAALLTTRLGTEVGVERDPYRILFTSKDTINPQQILDVLKEYNAEQVTEILRLSLKHTQTFASRFIHVGKRMDIIRRDSKVREIPVRMLMKAFEGTLVYEETMREVFADKLEIERVITVFEGVASGKIGVHLVNTTKASPLARLIIEEKTRFEVMGEITDESEVLRMMEDRLLSKKFRLICMGKGDWNSVRTISTLDDQVICPVCGSKMIAAVRPSDTELAKIVRKRVLGKSLNKEEEKIFKAGALVADLVARYGRHALFVLAGRGVGPRTASRLLRPGITDRLTALRLIALAEKDYERTKSFWS
ncbi:MAG: DEAD/DEAH box helicase [Candidatus Thorarchaeota archaeon]|nr:DEAD/DEAH box helicase [Candidatus Thorarchaeota archaeon]